jgi:hypothetical protein
MPDELDAQLRRYFAEQQAPLAAEPFVGTLCAALPGARRASWTVLPRSVLRALGHSTLGVLRRPLAQLAVACGALLGLWLALT